MKWPQEGCAAQIKEPPRPGGLDRIEPGPRYVSVERGEQLQAEEGRHHSVSDLFRGKQRRRGRAGHAFAYCSLGELSPRCEPGGDLRTEATVA
jgi:hypothetical protein